MIIQKKEDNYLYFNIKIFKDYNCIEWIKKKRKISYTDIELDYLEAGFVIEGDLSYINLN